MAYLIHRLFSMAITLFLISIITFTVTNILPGDVAMMIMGTQSNPEALANLREKRDRLYKEAIKFIHCRVELDLASFTSDIWSH